MIQRTHYLVTIRQRLKRLFVIHPGKDSCEMNDQTEAVAMASSEKITAIGSDTLMLRRANSTCRFFTR
jgi:hypothetical protein